MKKLLVATFLMLPLIAMGAKIVHKITKPDYVGVYAEAMKIVSVKTTEKATSVIFQYTGDGFSHFNKNICLIDEEGKHYELTGQKGLSTDSLGHLKTNKKGKYELQFEALPAHCHIFDIIEDLYDTSTRYYGVRQAGNAFTVSNPKEHNHGDISLPDNVFKVDTAYITGKVENINKNSEWKVKLLYDYAARLKGKNKHPQSAMIDEEGNFKLKTRVNGPTWDYLLVRSDNKQDESMLIPVLLCPDEEQNLQIKFREDVKYSEEYDENVGTLMRCTPLMGFSAPLYYKKHFIDENGEIPLEKVKKHFKNYDELSLYLSGKYGLSRMETELLRSQLSTTFAMEIISLEYRIQMDKYYKGLSGEEWKKAHAKWMDSTTPLYNICFSNMRCESNVFWASTDRYNIFGGYYLNNIPPYSKRMDDFQFYKWKTIFNKELKRETDGHYEGISYEITPDNLKKVENFEVKQLQLFYNWMLPLIREWRNKNGNDDLFEQIYLLSCIYSVPKIPYNSSSKYIYDQFTLARQMIHHPSFCRLAGEMFFEVEEYYHRNNDEREKGKEKK